MRTFQPFLIGLMSFVFVCGGITAVQAPDRAGGDRHSRFGEREYGGRGAGIVTSRRHGKARSRAKYRWVPTYVDKYGKPHAFCDRQTGIVIQKTPGSPLPGDLESDCENENGGVCTWDQARRYCANLTVGKSGQKGWRLMYIQELAALVDINSKSCTEDNLCLPDKHPFKDVQSAVYWSASTNADFPSSAWFVSL